MDKVFNREMEMKNKVKNKIERLELFSEELELKEDERVEIILYLLKERTKFRKKAEEYIRSLEIENDTLKEEINSLKTLVAMLIFIMSVPPLDE